ncbi:hypothetical protein MRB53_012854 [Persea americana]|uniref:Uncharacterized protein n=1 Tax=Persea americana TaxID=3435 RepID=A0ACC2LYU1_PERAE|nr:hypothetical protein MRB53_012854 [Persea americana]
MRACCASEESHGIYAPDHDDGENYDDAIESVKGGTKRRSTPIGTSALGLAMRQRCENGEVRLAVGRRTDLLRQAPRLSLRQSVRNVKTNCLTPPISSALALAVLR